MADRQRHFPKANARARRLRHETTPAERRLWKLLRRVEGCHFRRQFALGPHVFDFADLDKRLLIEVDGGIHDLPEVAARDRAKEGWANAQGFRVLRIPNAHVFGTGEPAMIAIMAALREA